MSGIEFLPLVGIALLFYLLVIRPQSRRQRELRTMQSSLDVGDEVMLTSGIYGTVTALDEDTAQVEVAAGVTLKVVRGAIGIVEREPTDQTDQSTGDPDFTHTDEHDEQQAGADGAVPEEKN